MSQYTSGSVATEQDLITQIDSFLTSTIGSWVRIGTITDTASDKDYVYKAPGPGNPGEYRDIYIRWRGYNNNLYVYGYSAWFDASTYSDELYSNSYAPTGSTTIKYWLFGDMTYLWVVLQNGTDAKYYSVFGGFIDSYYSYQYDPLPLAVVGHVSYVAGLTDSSRTRMYSATISGASTAYIALSTQTSHLAYGDPNTRDSSQSHCPFIVYSTTAGSKEVRGEFPGVVEFPGTSLASEDWVTVSGTDYEFFIRRYDTAICEGYGPVHI